MNVGLQSLGPSTPTDTNVASIIWLSALTNQRARYIVGVNKKKVTKTNKYKNSTYSEFFPHCLKGHGIFSSFEKIRKHFCGALRLLWALVSVPARVPRWKGGNSCLQWAWGWKGTFGRPGCQHLYSSEERLCARTNVRRKPPAKITDRKEVWGVGAEMLTWACI